MKRITEKMARLPNKKQEGGLPTKEQMLLSPQNTDRIPAQIGPSSGLGTDLSMGNPGLNLPGANTPAPPSTGNSQGLQMADTTPQPAKLSAGEYVISNPAIIGLGNGNYDKGLAHLDNIHQKLKEHGMKIMGGKQGSPQFGTPNQMNVPEPDLNGTAGTGVSTGTQSDPNQMNMQQLQQLLRGSSD